MKLLTRIIFLFSLLVLYLIIKELVELYVLARSLHPIVGFASLAAISAFIIYFIITPIFKIIFIPKYYGPTKDKSKIQFFIDKRMTEFKNNDFLKQSGFDFNNLSNNQENYQKIINTLKIETEKIRKRYVSKLFYSTSIVQNGFIEAILILSLSINLVKEIFILYNGRVSNRDLWTIVKKIYYSTIIGGSEGIEYATEEIFSKLGSDTLKGVPFLDKILGSLADGYVNAVLLTRIALITENYCSLIYIQSERNLYPSISFVLDATKNITSDITDKLLYTIKKLAIDKPVEYAKLAINPAAYVLREAYDKVASTAKMMGSVTSEQASLIKDSLPRLISPFYGMIDFISGFWTKQK